MLMELDENLLSERLAFSIEDVKTSELLKSGGERILLDILFILLYNWNLFAVILAAVVISFCFLLCH